MKEIKITYTKNKPQSLDEPFAILHFLVYNDKDLEEVLSNIENHFDGIVIEEEIVERKNKRDKVYSKNRRSS